MRAYARICGGMFRSYAEACRMGVEVISGNLRGKLEAQEKKPLARLWS